MQGCQMHTFCVAMAHLCMVVWLLLRMLNVKSDAEVASFFKVVHVLR